MPLSTEGPVIEASHLKVVRGGTTVLPDLSFSVAAGSVTGLLGLERFGEVDAHPGDRRGAAHRRR